VFPVVEESVPGTPQTIDQVTVELDTAVVAVKVTVPFTGTEAGCGEMLIGCPEASDPVEPAPQSARKGTEVSRRMHGTAR
jgi:hypothetical protein